MEKRKCDICGRIGEVQVVSSALGAVSFAYCSDCLLNNAEPKNLIQGTIEMLDGKVGKWVLELTYFDSITETYESAHKLMDKYKEGERIYDFDNINEI